MPSSHHFLEAKKKNYYRSDVGVVGRTLQRSQIQDHDDQLPPLELPHSFNLLTKGKVNLWDLWAPADMLHLFPDTVGTEPACMPWDSGKGSTSPSSGPISLSMELQTEES